MKRTGFSALVLTFAVLVPRSQAQQPRGSNTTSADASAVSDALLLPTNHPRLPRDVSQLWLVPRQPPDRDAAADARDVAAAIKLQAEGDYKGALPKLTAPGAAQGPLGEYAAY